MPAHLDGKEQNWLLIRKRDDTETREAVRGGRYKPMLATLVDELPRGGDWLYEVKFDGYRALAYVRGGSCELRSRNGNDLTARFAAVATAIAEAVARRRGARRRGLRARRARPPELLGDAAGPGRLVYYAFDCSRPAASRSSTGRSRSAASGWPSWSGPNATVSLSEAFEDGQALLEAVERQGLEGVMAKRAGSRYAQGRRTRDWLKIKTHGRQEFVIAGYTRGTGSRASAFGSLVLARQRGRRAAVRRQRRHRVRRPRDPHACSAAQAARAPRLAVRRAAEDAARPPGRRRLGRAAARGRGRVQRVDARRPRAPALVQGPARGQARRRGAARAAGGGRRPRRASASCGSRTSTSSSGPTRGSRRAISLDYYRQVAPVLVPHLKGGRSRCAATRTARSARRSSRRTRPRTCPTGSAPSATEVTTRVEGADAAHGRRSRSSTTSSRCSGW